MKLFEHFKISIIIVSLEITFNITQNLSHKQTTKQCVAGGGVLEQKYESNVSNWPRYGFMVFCMFQDKTSRRSNRCIILSHVLPVIIAAILFNITRFVLIFIILIKRFIIIFIILDS